MMNIKTLCLITLGACLPLSAFADAVAAAQAAPAECSHCHCFLPGCWRPNLEKLYVSGGPVYAKTKDFDGWGGSARLGYRFCKNDSLELELNGFEEKGDKSGHINSYTFPAGSIIYPSGIPSAVDITFEDIDIKRKARLDQWSIMLNYRYSHFLGECHQGETKPSCCQLGFYLGGGMGVNFVEAKGDLSVSALDTWAGKPAHISRSRTQRKAVVAGQVFGGVELRLLENLSLYGGARAFFTQEFNFNRSGLQGHPSDTTLESEIVHLLVDVGLSYQF